jgi:hypothetical protein
VLLSCDDNTEDDICVLAQLIRPACTTDENQIIIKILSDSTMGEE